MPVIEKPASIYNFSCETIDGKHLKLSTYRNKVLLIVNTASKCHYRSQLGELHELYERFKDYGLEILAFPCNQFLRQESANVHQINNTYTKKYDVDFQIFRKVKVNGKFAHPIYDYLKEAAPGAYGTKGIKWNFTKFLIDHNGKEVLRFSPATHIDAMLDDIVRMLEARMKSRKVERISEQLNPKREINYSIRGKEKASFSVVK